MVFKRTAILLSLVAGGGLVLASSLAPVWGGAAIVKAADITVDADSSRNPTYQTTRVFVHNSNAGNWRSSGAKTGIRVWDMAGNVTIYDTNWVNAGTEEEQVWIGYADVGSDPAGAQLVRLNPADLSNIWNWAPNFEGVSGAWSSRIYSLSEYDWSWTYQDLDLSYVSPDFAAILLEGYSACLASEVNGFLSYPTLEEKFFSKMDETALAAPLTDEYSYSDYVDNGNAYGESVSKGDGSYTVGDKIAQMKANYEAYQAETSAQAAALIGNESLNYLAAGAVSLVALAASVAGWAFIHRRKKQSV